MNEFVEGIVEAISQKNHGVKIVGSNFWINSINEEVDKQLEKILKGDKIKFKHQGKDLLFIESLTKIEDKDKPDWDKIAEGKVRSIVSVAFIRRGAPLDEDTKKDVKAWTKFIMEGI